MLQAIATTGRVFRSYAWSANTPIHPSGPWVTAATANPALYISRVISKINAASKSLIFLNYSILSGINNGRNKVKIPTIKIKIKTMFLKCFCEILSNQRFPKYDPNHPTNNKIGNK